MIKERYRRRNRGEKKREMKLRINSVKKLIYVNLPVEG